MTKYRAIPTIVDGKRFASKREAKRYQDLKHLQNAGMIKYLECQPRFNLEVNGLKICDYIADFIYQCQGQTVVEDSKGFRTPLYKLKKKLMRAVHGIEIVEV